MAKEFFWGLAFWLAGTAAAFPAQIVAMGASNTAGRGRGATPDGVPREQAFPAQLERVLNASGCHARVLNAGVAGDTTSGMLQRLPGSLGKDTKVLILQTGGNDARRGEAGKTQANVSAMREIAARRGIAVIMFDNLDAIAPAGSHLPDGQHFSAAGHAAFAAYLAPQARAACG